MINRVTLALFCLLLLLNCNNKSENVELSNVTSPVKVILEARVDKNDRFQLFYVTKANAAYDENKIINQVVIGSPMVQKIEFELPKQAYPVKLRIDLGDNKEQTPISIKNISVVKGDKAIEDKTGDFQKYWTTNQNIKYDAPSFTLALQPVEGVYDPMIISNPVLEKELAKLKLKNTEPK